MAILPRLGRIIAYIFYLIISPFVSLIHPKKPSRIPPTTDPLLTLSASTIAKKIRLREITCYEVVNAYIERIKEVNPYINAVVDNRFDEAIIEAKFCDDQLIAGNLNVATLEKEKPLYGVPFSVKECVGVKGLSHTGCTVARKGIKAKNDAAIVETLRKAGAIPLCVTNTPEMCCNIDTTNRLYGRTRNPYDARRSAGGSSGGEGALLGAGASLIGIGSDLGGSIRFPALFNGIFGYKPSIGIVSTDGHYPTCEDEVFLQYMIIGPLTRYADDLILVTKVLATQCNYNLRLNRPVNWTQVKVYYKDDLDNIFNIFPVTSEMQQCILKAVKHFSLHDIHTEKLPIDWPTDLYEISMAMYINIRKLPRIFMKAKSRINLLVEMGKSLLGLSPYTKFTLLFVLMAKIYFGFSKEDVLRYSQKSKTIRRNLMDLLGENGIFIYPTFRSAAFFPELTSFEALNISYGSIFNIFGFPTVHVPMGLNRNGLPIGVQIIAAPYQDRLCLAVAKELETAFGGWTPPTTSVNN